MFVYLHFKPGLHVVVRVAEHACDDASKRILKPSTYQLQIFLVRNQYLRSLLPHGDQTIAGQLEKHVLKPILAIFATYIWRPGFIFTSVSKSWTTITLAKKWKSFIITQK